jgi:hypothetical protein
LTDEERARGGANKSYASFRAAFLDQLKYSEVTYHRLAAIFLQKALKGDLHTLRFVAEMLEGKPKESVTIEADVNATQLIEVRYLDSPEPAQKDG